ncbi:hypothetical protein [Vagococcus salmoninarum]|uniref:DUF2187 domain-containing protein n=1 Tax=Vagococcus salmoninarum TaxID=2739 RepID=A0A429ZTY9_9ENTE|nr:hypothetical protein [Vagococcus salmoninarum]MBE9388442.1 hypothetical protein [Vagococcus salmoninarum]RST97090.1 hypothetical protein CBF35_03960 [Vagococcus salmoninarum]
MFRPAQKVASEIGKDFLPDTKVKFYFRGDLETGKVIKQMTNSAIISIKKTADNKDVIFQTNGNIVISYEDLKLKTN